MHPLPSQPQGTRHHYDEIHVNASGKFSTSHFELFVIFKWIQSDGIDLSIYCKKNEGGHQFTCIQNSTGLPLIELLN
jgi:hypothetical protein